MRNFSAKSPDQALPLKDIVRAAENLLGFPSSHHLHTDSNCEYLEKYDDADVAMGRFSRERPESDQGLFYMATNGLMACLRSASHWSAALGS